MHKRKSFNILVMALFYCSLAASLNVKAGVPNPGDGLSKIPQAVAELFVVSSCGAAAIEAIATGNVRRAGANIASIVAMYMLIEYRNEKTNNKNNNKNTHREDLILQPLQ